MHINRGHSSESPIPSSPHIPTSLTHKFSPSMTDVNPYYLGSPKRIFRAKLDSRLITKQEAQELCAKKYVQPHITNKNTLAAPLTEQELEHIKLQFPDIGQKPMPPCALSPMVWQLSDPDGMGATPTHQTKVHKINTAIWGPKDGSTGKILLPVPFHDPNQSTKHTQEDMLNMEGQATHKSCRQEKWAVGSLGSTALASTLATRSLWSCTTSIMTKDLYPAEHLFIRVLKDSDDPDETPYAATTTGFPLYKGSYRTHTKTIPMGFQQNDGDHFIPFPIKEPNGEMKQAEYVQTILHPNPIVVGLCDNSNKVYSKLLYASPIYHYDGKPTYTAQELEMLKWDVEGKEQMDCMIHRLHDPSLTAEVHHFCMVAQELD